MPEPYERPAPRRPAVPGTVQGPASATAPRHLRGRPVRRRFSRLGRVLARQPADPPLPAGPPSDAREDTARSEADRPPDPLPPDRPPPHYPPPDHLPPDRPPSGPERAGRERAGRDRAGPAATAQTAAPRTRVRPVGERREWPRSFAERLIAPRPNPGVRDLVRLVRECAVRPPAGTLKDAALLPVEQGPLPQAGPGDVAVSWAGHASWVLRIGGLTVLTDPVWSRRIPGTPARITPVGVPWDALPPVDAVVISHNHFDHLDAPTIRRLPRDTACFVPAGLGAWFRRRGFTRVTELDWWEAAEYRGVRFDFVPAHHWSRRTLTDLCRSLWGGWVLADGAGRRVYFAGDTGYGRCFADIGRAHPGIDLALLPIGAYAPRWMLRTVHTDPEEAVRAFSDLGAAAMAPMHWATFLLSGEPPLEPLLRLRAAWAAAGLPPHALWDLPVGGSRVL